MAKAFKLPKKIFDAHNHLWKDDNGSKILGWMDELGIETTLVMGAPAEFVMSTAKMAKVVRRNPKRLVGGAYYDPRKGKKAIAELKRYAGEGLKIVKVFPNLGWFPDDPKYGAFFDAVAENKMAVLSHCGWLGGAGAGMIKEEWATYHATPGRFEKVVRTHPETIFIMAHFGGIPGVLESVMLTTRTPNLYVDCSPGQGLWAIEKCGAIAGSVPAEKLLWGADCKPTAEFLERYRKDLVAIGYGEHLEKIFYTNARGIFEKLGVLK